MQVDYANTIFALVLGLTIVAVFWSIIMFYAELGSEEGKREYKAMIIGSITTLIALMLLYVVILWVRGGTGI